MGARNLAQMRSFYLDWSEEKILQTLSAKSSTTQFINDIEERTSTISALASRFALPWSAYVRLLAVKRPEARSFYEAEALRSGWSVRQLDRQINSQFYERIALSKNKSAMLQKAETAEPGDTITPEAAIKDPFVLEFLNLKDEYSESDLEEALIQHLTDFLLELGDDFAFVGRQRRLRLDDNWFRVDLVFFHRRLRCLVIADLKAGRFSYADAGQMHIVLELCPRELDEARREPAGWPDSMHRKGSRRSTLYTRPISPTRFLRPSTKPFCRKKKSSQRNWTAPAGNWRNDACLLDEIGLSLRHAKLAPAKRCHRHIILRCLTYANTQRPFSIVTFPQPMYRVVSGSDEK